MQTVLRVVVSTVSIESMNFHEAAVVSVILSAKEAY